MQFRDLDIGQTFDFVRPGYSYNTFFDRCVKTSPRLYVSVDNPTKLTYKVGTVKCEVYHVGEAEAR